MSRLSVAGAIYTKKCCRDKEIVVPSSSSRDFKNLDKVLSDSTENLCGSMTLQFHS